ncbi:hypothetical protein GWI33_020785 [Rhynchophorus ferrugineus]|uniref:Uncharacterized protein n=1 Tax=Rhynchophorus ferrugineus TaxID=354439 RepID=A0A834HRI1_RHYFE|nr:hypothetical protein GWI33_020785 [Rhynchophorus ferrugineus]
MSGAPAIGIDLGTSFSAAAVFLDTKKEVLPNNEGYRTTPSCIFYNEHNSNICVGTTAYDQSFRCITNYLYDAKRIIGRKPDDPYVKLIRDSEDYHFNLTNDDDDVVFQFRQNGRLIKKTPEEVSSEILKFLKKSASEYLGADIQEAVISVPGYFSNAQKKATMKAAELAGLKVLRLITEPVAGALHYLRENPQINGKVLVYDFGGGTFDASVIEVKDKEFSVLNMEGDCFLGGRDMDKLLVNYFKDVLNKMYGKRIITQKLMRLLQEKSVVIKEKLSVQDEYTVQIQSGDGNYKEIQLFITRKDYEEIISELVGKSMDIVKKCLKGLNTFPKDITIVVLIGGVTRTPLVRRTVGDYFGASKLKTNLHPDEAVAHGAAYHAALLTDQCKEIKIITITEVTPLTLGISVARGLMCVIIEKGSKLPVIKHTIISTLDNDQTSMTFKIYEGERKNTIYNNYLGKFSCNNIPKRKAGDVKIKITYILDCDGILHIEAEVLSTRKITKLTVRLQDYGLHQNETKFKIPDSEATKYDDDLIETSVRIYRDIKQVINHITYSLKNIYPTVRIKYVIDKCSALRMYMEQTDYNTSFKEILEKFKIFHEAVKDLLIFIDVDFEKPLKELADAIRKFN